MAIDNERLYEMAEYGLLKLYLREKESALKHFPIHEVMQATDMIWETYKKGGTVYACGNGGNAASVGNLITDLANHLFVTDDKSKPLPENIQRLRTVDLCSSGAALTAYLNDFGKEYVFSQQLICNRVAEGDTLFGFSGSGTSGNIRKACEIAKKHGAKTILVTRNRNAVLEELIDLSIVFEGHSQFPGQIGSNDFNFHYEDLGFAMAHMITGLLRKRIYDEHNRIKS